MRHQTRERNFTGRREDLYCSALRGRIAGELDYMYIYSTNMLTNEPEMGKGRVLRRRIAILCNCIFFNL